MAKFTIYSPLGVALYSGTPSFTGQYMKPGLLEFREIASPSPIDFTAGCYVDYSRTGHRYRIYTVPQVKKQSRSLTYGGAFLYQGVQLFDASKMLEYCPFRDLVAGDNRIHFSTQPSISTFEGCDGLARRFEACLRDQYDVNGVQSWRVRIATDDENPDLYELMLEPREFTVSGMNILECLNKVYEIWPDVGWVYKVEDGIDTIVIGGGGINANEGTYAYGKGMGLTSLTRTVANAEEMANRIYAYGASRNMLPGWYNSQNIKDAESVDIQNLMIPVSEWGKTEVDGVELPDAAKAYVEDADSIAKMGLRPATVYFDGKGEYPAIYPSIREKTIGMVRAAMEPTDKYYPNTLIYRNPDARIDKLMSAQSSFDSGLSAGDGKSAIATDYKDFADSGSGTAPASLRYLQKMYLTPFLTQDVDVDESGEISVTVKVAATGTVTTTMGYVGILVGAYSVVENAETLIQSAETKMLSNDAGTAWELTEATLRISNSQFPANATLRIKAQIALGKSNANSDGAYSFSLSGSTSVKATRYRAKTFRITLRQIGFDIAEQANLGDGKTIAMRSGDCAGRSFAISDVQYDNGRDCWVVDCWRTEDESLSQWFPNSSFKVRANDEFVLLDIAMPSIYMDMAEQKLLQEAEGLLADTATERWQYIPEIDAKYMVENSRTIRAGEFMAILDSDIIEGGDGQGIRYFRTSGGDYFLTSNGDRILLSGSGGVSRALVDTIVINEGDAIIPTYKVTLRDRKRKTWTESESAETGSSKSVGNASQNEDADMTNYVRVSDFEDLTNRVSNLESESFFTLDESGNVTLKSAYSNLWVPGWMAAGGVGTGGGGSVGSLYDLLEVDGSTSPSQDDVFYFDGSKWTSIPVKTINGNSILGSGNIVISGGGGGGGSSVAWGTPGSDYIPLTVDGTTKNLLTAHQSLTNYALKTGGSSYNFRVSTLILPNGTLSEYTGSGYNEERIKFTYTAGSSLNTAILAYLTDIPTALKNPKALTFGNKTYDGSVAMEILASDIGAASASDLTTLSGRVTNIEGWFEVVNVGTAQLPEYALHAKSGYAIYSDSWISAGGVGSGGGGGGSSTLSGLVDVSISNPSSNNVLTYNGSTSHWVNTAKDTFLSGYATQSWVQGQGYLTQHQSLANYVTLDGAQTITGAKTFSSTLSVNAGISVNGISTIEQNTNDHLALFNYGGRTSQVFNAYGTTVNLRVFNASEQANILSVQTDRITVGSQLIPNYTTGLNLGGSSSNQRWSTIYGVNANLSGDLTLAATSHIDIGPLRIEYDSTNKALHITKVSSSDTENYGIYADGFVSAGGVQATS